MNENFSADYISIIRRLGPLMLVGGVMALILHSSEIMNRRPWFKVVSAIIQIFTLGAAAAFVSALMIPYIPYLSDNPETHLMVAAMAGVSGQKTFDFIQAKIFKYDPGCILREKNNGR
jgi:hypothetical protein